MKCVSEKPQFEGPCIPNTVIVVESMGVLGLSFRRLYINYDIMNPFASPNRTNASFSVASNAHEIGKNPEVTRR